MASFKKLVSTRANMVQQMEDMDLTVKPKKKAVEEEAKEGEGYGGKPSSSRKAADEFRAQEKREKGK